MQNRADLFRLRSGLCAAVNEAKNRIHFACSCITLLAPVHLVNIRVLFTLLLLSQDSRYK